MKKICSVILILLILVSLVACGNSGNSDNSHIGMNNTTANEEVEKDFFTLVKTADTTDVSLFEYEVIEGEMTLTNYIGSDEIVVIPDTIEGQSVKVIGEYCFANNETIKGVRLSDSVTRIGNDAFENCYGLEVLVCGQNLETIGEYAFNFCTSLETVELNQSCRVLEVFCFANTAIGRIYIPATVESMESTFLMSSKEDEMVIEGKSDSYAEQYATENGYTFEAK